MRIFQCRKILKAAASDCSDGQHAYKHGIWTKSLTNTDATRRSKWFVANEHTTCDHEHSDKLKCGSVEELLFLFIFFVAIFYFLSSVLFFSLQRRRHSPDIQCCDLWMPSTCFLHRWRSRFIFRLFCSRIRWFTAQQGYPRSSTECTGTFTPSISVYAQCLLSFFFVLLSGRCCTNNISIVVFYVGCEYSRYKYRNMNGTNNQFVECFFFLIPLCTIFLIVWKVIFGKYFALFCDRVRYGTCLQSMFIAMKAYSSMHWTSSRIANCCGKIVCIIFCIA